jgi:hypothetical protein
MKNIPVRPRTGTNNKKKAGALTVAVKNLDDLDGGYSFFLRDNLYIPEVKYGKAPGDLIGVVVSESDELAELLRDAENPAHRNWLQRADKLTSNYIAGSYAVSFTKNIISNLFDEITADNEEVDETLLADIFPVIKPDQNDEEQEGKKKRKIEYPETSSMFNINVARKANTGGFTVSLNKKATDDELERVQIKVAYDTARGNPFIRHSNLDFDFWEQSKINLNFSGCVLEEASGNELIISVKSHNFRVQGSGFDSSRDLVVRCEALETKENK